MPDLIYNVKFEIDSASAQQVGQIVDSSNSQDIKVLQKEVERLNSILKENMVENGKVKKSVKEKILAYKEEVASLKLLDSKINKSIQVYGEFSDETMALVTDLRMQSEVVDNAGQELLQYANTTDRTTGEVVALTNAVSTGNRAMVAGAKRAREMSRAQQIMGGQLGTTNKTFAAGNQAVFSFSDLIQDSTQFSYGFAQGMRAIGNNIGFTAELLAVMSAQAKQAGVSLTSSLMASLKGVNGIVLGINVAVTVATVLLQKFGKQAKETAEDLKEANKSADLFLKSTTALVDALTELDALGTDEVKQRFEKERIENEINRLQLLEQQSQVERQRLNNEIDTLKAKRESISISRTSTFISEQEVAAIAQKNQLSREIEEVEQRLARLDAQKEDRAEQIAQYQKQQMELGETITINKGAEAEAEQIVLDILTKRRQEGQAVVDLLKEGRDLPALNITGELQLKQLSEGEFVNVLTPFMMAELDLNQARVEANKAMFDAMFENAQGYADAQRALNINIAKTEINTRKMVLSTLSSLAGAFSQENKAVAYALLAIEKGLAIAEVVVDGSKRAAQAANAAAFFSANPLTAALGASYTASAAAIKANTAATVAAIAAQGIGQAASIARAGGATGASGTPVTAQTGTEEFFGSISSVTDQSRNISFRPSNESDAFKLNIKNEVVATPKGLAIITRAGEREIANSQKTVR